MKDLVNGALIQSCLWWTEAKLQGLTTTICFCCSQNSFKQSPFPVFIKNKEKQITYDSYQNQRFIQRLRALLKVPLKHDPLQVRHDLITFPAPLSVLLVIFYYDSFTIIRLFLFRSCYLVHRSLAFFCFVFCC